MLLLRLGYYASAWDDSADVSKFCRAQFPNHRGVGLDLAPSVYEVMDRAEIIRAHAEHQASWNLQGPNRQIHLDLEGLAHAVPTLGEGVFEFTRARHREMHFASVDDLVAKIATALQQADRRRHDVTKDDVRAYVTARVAAQDPEWLAFMPTNAKWAKFARPRDRPPHQAG